MVGLIHRVSVVRYIEAGGEDEWLQPGRTIATVATDVPALVQHRRGIEIPEADGAGVTVATGVIFTGPTEDITEKDVIAHDGEEWRVIQVRNAGGAGHHLEIDAERVRL